MIEFQNVSKSFGDQQVLDDASFLIKPGERVGIVGPNGAGKSTVFNLIVGDLTPDGGTITLARGGTLGYMHQELRPDATDVSLIDYTSNPGAVLEELQDSIEDLHAGLENSSSNKETKTLRELGELQTKFEHLGGYDIQHRAEATLCGLGFTQDSLKRPFGSFSGGWKLRAELARLLVGDPDILLLDEPSNYLDIPALEWLQRFLSEFKGTLALVSHDRFLLNSLTNITLEIANATATRYAGGYDRYTHERQRRYEVALAAWKNQDRRRKQIERFIERFRAKNTKATQVQSKIKMLERMEKIEIPARIVSPGNLRLPKAPRSGQEVARLDDAGMSYDDTNWVLRNVNWRIERGQKIAFVGLNGTGKTTLLRSLAGDLPLAEGRRAVGHKVVMGYQSQDFTETLDPRQSVFDNVRSVSMDMSDQATRTLLGGFGFSGDDVHKKVEILSGGEKVRVAFARLMMQPTNLLILDEPTTHLDIVARETLESTLKAYEGTLCLVSHDIDFVRNVATHIVAMTPPGVTEYWGDYDYYRQKMDEAEGRTTGPTKDAEQKSARKASRRERAQKVQEFAKLTRPLKETIRKAESRLENLESEQAKLLEQLEAGPKGYADINQRLTLIQKEIARNTEKWEQAAEKLERLEQKKDY